jgi:hypothetical protein
VEHIETARVAAGVENDWSRFVQVVGGIECGRRTSVRLWKGLDWRVQGCEELPRSVCGTTAVRGRLDVSRGFVLSGRDQLNQYDEERPQQIIGVECTAGRVVTRQKIWRIERKGGFLAASYPGPVSLGPVSITVRGSTSVPSVPITGEHASRPIKPKTDPPWMH